ncbi:pseudomonalisin [Acrasis kona]|uniref:Pseudomonalisin n=1 Tax=Acrasis kona TaxID=1008807 RepID=A0AAW2YLD2_9EUKA
MNIAIVTAILSLLMYVCAKGNARPYYIVNKSPSRRTRFAPDARDASILGLTPAEIKAIYSYNTSMSAGSGHTIGIVAAYDSPNIESELSTYSTQFGLPACTTANGCFKKVGQTGSSYIPSAPSSEKGWVGEISLDVELVHAIAPGAKILLVLANSAESGDVLTAVNYAKKHANYINMSFGFSEDGTDLSSDTVFSQSPSVSFFAASGDSGSGVEYPSSSPYVIAVGGTTLSISAKGVITETGWVGSGGGPSQIEPASLAQSNSNSVQSTTSSDYRSFRKVPDVSCVADPNSGVAVYSNGIWQVFGGTSAATPIITARASHTGKVVNANYIYNGGLTFRDIVTGYSQSTTTSLTYSCNVGYDYVTGMGSWIGLFNSNITTIIESSTTSPSASSAQDSSSSGSLLSFNMIVLTLCIIINFI